MTQAVPSPALRPRVVVVGGGIAGLAAAVRVRVQRPDVEVVVLESAPEVGGKLRVAEIAGIPVDVGAEAMLVRRPEGVALVESMGLSDQRIDPLTTSAAVRAGGALHPMPARTMMGVPADVDALRHSGVVGEHSLLAVAAEASLPPLEPLREDVSVGGLVRSRMGDEVLDRLVEPLLGGVYAGRADALSLQATMPALAAVLAERGGSLLQAAASVTDVGTRAPGSAPVFTSLRGGLGRLPQRMAALPGITVRTATTVRAVTRTGTGFALDCGPVPETERLFADAVIIATPAAKAARLLGDVAPAAAGELAGVESASVAIVTFAFEDVNLPAGSGLLVGAREQLAVKGVTISSQKWPLAGAAAPGLAVLRASVGRAGEAGVLQRQDEELIELVRRDLRALLGIVATPLDALVTRWGGGLPQYAVGHIGRVARVRAAIAAVPGLGVCGATYDGVGIPACIGSAAAAADQVLAALPVRGQ